MYRAEAIDQSTTKTTKKYQRRKNVEGTKLGREIEKMQDTECMR